MTDTCVVGETNDDLSAVEEMRDELGEGCKTPSATDLGSEGSALSSRQTTGSLRADGLRCASGGRCHRLTGRLKLSPLTLN